MRTSLYLSLLLGLTCMLAGCPMLGTLTGGGKSGGGDTEGGKENRQEEREDDDSRGPRLQWYATEPGEYLIPCKIINNSIGRCLV